MQRSSRCAIPNIVSPTPFSETTAQVLRPLFDIVRIYRAPPSAAAQSCMPEQDNSEFKELSASNIRRIIVKKLKNRNIENVAVDALKPYGNNARTHSAAQIKQIAQSIERFGFTNPVLADKSLGIIA